MPLRTQPQTTKRDTSIRPLRLHFQITQKSIYSLIQEEIAPAAKINLKTVIKSIEVHLDIDMKQEKTTMETK